MKHPEGSPENGFKQPRIMSLQFWFFSLLLVALLIIGLLAAGFFVLRNALHKSENELEKVKQVQAQNETARLAADEKAKVTLARNKQDEALQIARSTIADLDELAITVNHLRVDITELQTNATGRIIATSPDAIAQARHVYDDAEQSLPKTSEFAEKSSTLRRIETQITSALGTTFDPDASVSQSVHDAQAWTATHREAAHIMAARLESLRQEALVIASSSIPASTGPGRVNAATSLQTAMLTQVGQEQKRYDQIVDAETGKAKLDAANTDAQSRAELIRLQALAEKSKTDMESSNLVSKIHKSELRAKASQPDIQAQLAPFLKPGIWIPSTSGAKTADRFDIEARPMSLSKLNEMGALTHSQPGLRTFVSIGMSHNNDRPHLDGRFKFSLWYTKADSVAEASRLQALLIELGPTFVDMGLLQP